jgi:outer membrane translocation and assembly module TamA
VVTFAEVGKVNDQYNFELLRDLKYDVGISLRALVEEIPVRVDIGYGEEGANMWVMIQQPFDF